MADDEQVPLPPPLFPRTRYFALKVMQKRPIDPLIIKQILARPDKRKPQPDGRVRFWGWVHERQCWYRVVTLADGETAHNTFPDRDFEP